MGALSLLVLLVYLYRCCCKSGCGHEKQSANGSRVRFWHRSDVSKLNVTPVDCHHMDASVELSLLPPPALLLARTPLPDFGLNMPLEIGADRLRFLEPLRQGQFGQVWKGELVGCGTQDEPKQVLFYNTAQV